MVFPDTNNYSEYCLELAVLAALDSLKNAAQIHMEKIPIETTGYNFTAEYVKKGQNWTQDLQHLNCTNENSSTLFNKETQEEHPFIYDELFNILHAYIVNILCFKRFFISLFNNTCSFCNNFSYNPVNSSFSMPSSTVSEDEVIFQSIKDLNEFFIMKNITSFLNSPWFIQFLSLEKWTKFYNFSENLNPNNAQHFSVSQSSIYITYKFYVDPVLFSIYLIVGLAWNGALLVLFIRHEEIRVSSNIMILNLAVCDILNLCVSGSLLYMGFCICSGSDLFSVRVFITMRQFFSSASALSLVALSVQRFSITVSCASRWTSSLIDAAYVVIVWILAVVLSVPLGVDEWAYVYDKTQDYVYPHKMVFLIGFVLYCALFPSCMFLFNSLTVRRLKRSTSGRPEVFRYRVQEKVKKRSANVVTPLAALFVISYLPYEMWCLIVYWVNPKVYRYSDSVMCSVIKYFMLADACFNPVALYLANGTFRRLFRRYFCCSTSSHVSNGRDEILS